MLYSVSGEKNKMFCRYCWSGPLWRTARSFCSLWNAAAESRQYFWLKKIAFSDDEIRILIHECRKAFLSFRFWNQPHYRSVRHIIREIKTDYALCKHSVVNWSLIFFWEEENLFSLQWRLRRPFFIKPLNFSSMLIDAPNLNSLATEYFTTKIWVFSSQSLCLVFKLKKVRVLFTLWELQQGQLFT